MAGGVRENVICFLGLRLPDIPKNVPVFLEDICATLCKTRQARQDGGLEARWTNCFEWYFLM